jgi:hypothetical protein
VGQSADGDGRRCLQPHAVTEFAQLIDDLARRVETALSTSGDTQQTAASG